MVFLPDAVTQRQGSAVTASPQSFMFYAPYLNESSSFEDDQGCEAERFHGGSSAMPQRSGMSDADSFESAPSLLFYAPCLSEVPSEFDTEVSRGTLPQFCSPSPLRRFPTNLSETSPSPTLRTPTLPKIPKPALRRPPSLACVPFVPSCGSFEEEFQPPAAVTSRHSPVTSQHSPVTSPRSRRKSSHLVPIPPAVAEFDTSRALVVHNPSPPTTPSLPPTRTPFSRRWASHRQLVHSEPPTSCPLSPLSPVSPLSFLQPKAVFSSPSFSTVPNRTSL